MAGLGRYGEALEAYGRAMQLEPDYAWAHCRRARTCSLLGRREEALRDLGRAVDLDGDFWGKGRTDGDSGSLHGDPEFRQLVGLDDAGSE